MALVILVVFYSCARVTQTIIPAVAVPVSLIGTFAAMYLCGFSLNNLSLMALTIATGFVVDDAIVVLENIARHLEAGMKPLQAALQGTREVGFYGAVDESVTGGGVPAAAVDGRIAGRLLREFAVTLSVAMVFRCWFP
ncbi:putative multidrug transporter [Escherichia coli]|uniref:Putative multidrug transporter n=1 Tax=Escherichia coli TaxID=562 RepID=A0A377CCZ2_ECOLX|nr:putative multidrug transporter [Escherichia coli]